ncbi:type II toxin-antitoxin system Phd/YefM family antitoxin [Leifsonia sp. H3M29-4]|jgi:antitoxin (DNA-binding transcriptional repressor) of toxin-antitoxin stability system|uniref:type II toxin-antitoxin system Phd/YefM family antitoxin n=1 Tax=Salinibacterium metalliresistens TaxID=3031321 RepID=UPI0009639D2F|nr:type II toxin-antitoxin system Phd/YefM family antitoxin [Salinibacterium metalliresistens]MBN9139240.1 type II toxin-antitoxin system Phd/YefM family antitoxin [Micrococcales bacterium]MDF1477907.1 type II toxin-antitoxin system Phd/YefM family antitoxin [Salinibacterium metalliresistens]OJX66841.1 MAG: hypothetical protein BGO94_08405 [Micrococcales bacterium 72-143]
MSVTVGVREFRQDLADYIDQAEPVTVTRHGQTVGLFIPVRRDRKAEIAAYSEAAKKASALLEQLGMTEDEVVAEFDAMRKARRKEPREAASAS